LTLSLLTLSPPSPHSPHPLSIPLQVVELIGRINKCGVISPRFDCCHNEIEQWVVNLLPARQFGHIILTTSYGIMDHEEARRKHTGGKILGFFY
jgi:small subunit ribosomal protein S15Ae